MHRITLCLPSSRQAHLFTEKRGGICSTFSLKAKVGQRQLQRSKECCQKARHGTSLTVIWYQACPGSEEKKNFVPTSLDQLDGSCVSDSLGGLPIDLHNLVPNLQRNTSQVKLRHHERVLQCYQSSHMCGQACRLSRVKPVPTITGHQTPWQSVAEARRALRGCSKPLSLADLRRLSTTPQNKCRPVI